MLLFIIFVKQRIQLILNAYVGIMNLYIIQQMIQIYIVNIYLIILIVLIFIMDHQQVY